MKPYTVEWLPAAEDELARIWTHSSNRAGITAADSQIEYALAQDPVGKGRFLSEGLYQIDVPPLAVSYTIDQTRQHVEVTWVREIIS